MKEHRKRRCGVREPLSKPRGVSCSCTPSRNGAALFRRFLRLQLARCRSALFRCHSRGSLPGGSAALRCSHIGSALRGCGAAFLVRPERQPFINSCTTLFGCPTGTDSCLPRLTLFRRHAGKTLEAGSPSFFFRFSRPLQLKRGALFGRQASPRSFSGGFSLLGRSCLVALFCRSAALFGCLGRLPFLRCRAALLRRAPSAPEPFAAICAVDELRSVCSIERNPAPLGIAPAVAIAGFNDLDNGIQPNAKKGKDPALFVGIVPPESFGDVNAQSSGRLRDRPAHIPDSLTARAFQRVNDPIHALPACAETPIKHRVKRTLNLLVPNGFAHAV